MFRMLPPAGAPISLADIARAVLSRVGQRGSGHLKTVVSEYTSQKHSFFVDSGKTAMLCGLRALARQADAFRNEVVIPAYTCFTVPAAIVRSGLKVHPVDIDPMTMDYDYNRLETVDFSRVLAVVGNNLFGIPSSWSVLRSLAKENGVYLVDDSAQTMGLEYKGGPLGGFGAFGFYSLGRGKNLSAYSGGILLTNDDQLSRLIVQEVSTLPDSKVKSEILTIAKTIALSMFLHPRLYWIPARMPFLKLGETIFDPDFETERLSPLQIALTDVMIEKLSLYNEKRHENSRLLIEGIESLPQYRIPGLDSSEHHTYLRLPVLTESKAARDNLMVSLRRRGVSASPMYPSSVRHIPGIERYLATAADDFPGADTVAEKLVTLPTHPYLKKSDITRIVATLAES